MPKPQIKLVSAELSLHIQASHLKLFLKTAWRMIVCARVC